MTLTLGILSWKSHSTLRNTLESYRTFGLDTLASQRVIWFQEITDEDREIAEEYGYEAIGSDTNVGIAGGYKGLVEHATGSVFLFLENDWVLLENPIQALVEGIYTLSTMQVDVIRYRHRDRPGVPLWTYQFQGHELEHPTHLLDSVHWTDPDRFPQIDRLVMAGTWFVTRARYANWTNNPTMFRVDWLKENILPRMAGDIEQGIQSWWEQQDYLVAQGEGLFTHNRIDR